MKIKVKSKCPVDHNDDHNVKWHQNVIMVIISYLKDKGKEEKVSPSVACVYLFHPLSVYFDSLRPQPNDL